MTVFRPRTRMISVRLSEDEYAALLQMCVLTGARSVSELTRDAMRELLSGSKRERSISVDPSAFHSQMKDLERKIEQLTADITMLKVNGSSTGTRQ